MQSFYCGVCGGNIEVTKSFYKTRKTKFGALRLTLASPRSQAQQRLPVIPATVMLTAAQAENHAQNLASAA